MYVGSIVIYIHILYFVSQQNYQVNVQIVQGDF